jgi:uncharacterized integral membrane protein (TIGR00698 family)
MTPLDSAQAIRSPLDRATSAAAGLVPGLLLAATIAAAAFGLRSLSGVGVLSPMILAIVIGMAFNNIVGTPANVTPGVSFAMRRILRFAIILLGLQITAQQVASVGVTGLLIIAVSLVSTFVFTKQLGRLLGVDSKMAELIAAGTSVCGASAVIATNTVTRAHEEDVAYAVAGVTVFGSIAMLAYPLIGAMIGLDDRAYGLWTGASIHEIAQVVAAAFQGGQAAGEFGTIAKLSRVMMLAPLVMALAVCAKSCPWKSARRETAGSTPLPWFVIGFVGLVLINSVVTIPAEVKTPVVTLTLFLLSMSLAAMGLVTDFSKLRAKGPRPFILGAASSAFIAVLSLGMIKLL